MTAKHTCNVLPVCFLLLMIMLSPTWEKLDEHQQKLVVWATLCRGKARVCDVWIFVYWDPTNRKVQKFDLRLRPFLLYRTPIRSAQRVLYLLSA